MELYLIPLTLKKSELTKIRTYGIPQEFIIKICKFSRIGGGERRFYFFNNSLKSIYLEKNNKLKKIEMGVFQEHLSLKSALPPLTAEEIGEMCFVELYSSPSHAKRFQIACYKQPYVRLCRISDIYEMIRRLTN